MHKRMAFLISFLVLLTAGKTYSQVTIEAANATVVPNESFCINLQVEKFTAITNFQFSVSWDPNIIRLDTLQKPNLAPWNDRLFTNLSLAPTGAIPIIWIDPESLEGVTVEDGDSIFQMCFTTLGAPGQFSDVSLTNLPLNMEIADVNSQGANIGIEPKIGRVTIVQPYGFSNTQITDVNCAALSSGAIDISPIGAVSPYSYQWEGPNGFSATSEDIDGLEEGMYILTITDSSMPPLVEVDTFFVDGNFNAPIADAGEGGRLDCNTTSITLNGISSSMGPDISYQWQSPQGNIVSGGTTLTPTVNGGGAYTLIVMDDNNGCFSESTVIVEMDTIAPAADPSAPQALDCAHSEVNLSIGNSATGADINYNWTTSTGNIINGADGVAPLVDIAGDYMLMVSDASNGCTATSAISLNIDTIPPLAIAGSGGQIDCTNSEYTLDASASSTGSEYTYQWTTQDGNILSGANGLMPIVDESGTYTLQVMDLTNSCTATASLEMTKNVQNPEAVSSPDTSVTCGAREIFLSASGSTVGPTIVYNWTTTEGNILSGEDSQMPLIDGSGSYQLVVTDESNGCTATAFVNVSNSLPQDADAGINNSVCIGETMLEGNLAPALTGVWTTSSSAVIDQVDQQSTIATNLQDGANLFIWTLSTPGCPDYDSDTLVITYETVPVANEDFFDVPYGAAAYNLDLVANDDLSNQSDWTLTLLSQATGGQLEDLGNGQLAFTSTNRFHGLVEFDYELCNALCPDFCDTAMVRLNVRENIDSTLAVANAITPNGDGVNDFFIINEILEEPEAYPNSSLIVFNRWGDIVYKAQPYLNNWSGQSDSDGDLPEGTYYYVVQLRIGESTIYRGDVTILR